MGKPSETGSQSVAPFLKKCYEMVDDETTNSIISWSENNNSFIIWNMTEFSVQLLPKFFKHNNFASFIRQLNIYGFRKIDTDRWEFANDGFVRGQKDLLKNIARRKYSQGSEQRKQFQLQQQPQQQENSIESSENNENIALCKEVEDLKTDKNALMQELVKLSQHQETAEKKVILLKDRLQRMEKSQQQLLSFLIMAMQSPGFLVQLIQPKENNWRMSEPSNMLEQITEDDDSVPSDHMIVRYQPPADGTSKPVHAPVITSENSHESDNSSDGMKDFWMNIDFVKVLMDESHTSFIPPDLYDDGAWEKLLLADAFLENNDDDKYVDKEEPVGSGMQMEVTGPGTHWEKTHNFELLLENMEKSQNLEIEPLVQGSQLESQNLELLTEQMGYLTSKSSLHGIP